MSGGREKGGHGSRSGERILSWGAINKIKISAWLLLHETHAWIGP